MKKQYLNKKLYGFIVLLIISGAFIYNLQANSTAPTVTVYKSPTCQCCNKWIAYLEDNGFQVKAKNTRQIKSIKDKYGIKGEFASCHTAIIGKYFVEGHVPAQSINRLLDQKPDIKGITVPGMPIGSPGMEVGSRVDRYNVIAVSKNGNLSIYDRY